MIRSLTIDGYRGFRDFKLEDIGRINLLVGDNGSGKTSLLEAIALLGAEDLFASLAKIQASRGLNEADAVSTKGLLRHFKPSSPSTSQPLAHIEATCDDSGDTRVSWHQLLRFVAIDQSASVPKDAPAEFGLERALSGLAYLVQLKRTFDSVEARGTSLVYNLSGQLRLDRQGRALQHTWSGDKERHEAALGVSAMYGSAAPRSSWTVFDASQATQMETWLVESLRLFDDEIVDYAVRESANHPQLVVRRRNTSDSFPVQLCGEGLVEWATMLEVAAASGSRVNALCFDEIFSRVHYQKMPKLWASLNQLLGPERQLFATTHTSDCLGALRTAIQFGKIDPSDVRVFRMRGGKPPVPYSAEEFLAAPEVGAEVR